MEILKIHVDGFCFRGKIDPHVNKAGFRFPSAKAIGMYHSTQLMQCLS